MSESEVPEEYRNLVADWQDWRLSRTAILQKYGLTRYALERTLWSLGVAPRRKAGAKGRPARPNLIEQGDANSVRAFVADYETGVLSQQALAEKYDLTAEALYRIRTKLGLRLRHDGLTGRPRNAVNDAFFDELTPASAWLLGLWLTDGWLTSGGPTGFHKQIGIAFKDEDLVLRIRELLGAKNKVTYKALGPAWSLQITSSRLYQRLFNLGVAGRGPNRLHLPIVPDALFPHLIRGIIDGDGSIFLAHHKPNYTFCGVAITFQCRSMLEELAAKLHATLGINPRINKTSNKNNCWYLSIHHRDNLKLLPWLYRDSEGLRLERKYLVALHFMNPNSLETS